MNTRQISRRQFSAAPSVATGPSVTVKRLAWVVAATLAIMGFVGNGFAQGVISVNGSFDSGPAGWTFSGGAGVVATGEAGDNPYGRVPDGALVFLYQKLWSLAPQFVLSFDYFTGLMSPTFPSPGGFPDTTFATVYFAATEPGLQPELLQSGASLALFDFDAENSLSGVMAGATLAQSPTRSGWTRFEGVFDSVAGQPFFGVTFQNFNANGLPGDSAFLVDNLRVAIVPEPAAAGILVAGLALISLAAVNRKRAVTV